jgi:hypothetical protein
MLLKKIAMLFCLTVMLNASAALAEESPREIQDNSFLIEEAYNQEDGVIQHIQTFQYMKDANWLYTFTQEWPVPNQTHQLSYTIPIERIKGGGQDDTGIGDFAINYRYQAVLKDGIAFSPRLSLILPTGDEKKGLGTGSFGYQVNMPLSIKLAERWVTHYNMGLTFTPNSKDATGAKADTVATNYGASAIFLASKNLNLMLEVVGGTEQTVQGSGVTANENSLLVSPGFRYALDLGKLQVVPGIAFPIGMGPSKGEYGAFAYLSFEHPLF